jgi:hypothetical protein
LESDLSQAKTKQVLAVLQKPEILDALKRRPIKEIIIRRLADRTTSAFYVYEDQSITVNSARKLGVHFGEEFRPGVTINMSAATTDKMESTRRALLQEIAHRVLEGRANSCGVGLRTPRSDRSRNMPRMRAGGSISQSRWSLIL